MSFFSSCMPKKRMHGESHTDQTQQEGASTQMSMEDIQRSFQRLIDQCVHQLPQNVHEVHKQELVRNISHTLKNSENDGSMYAESLQHWAHTELTIETDNETFLTKILSEIAELHAQHYELYPIPESYDKIIYDKKNSYLQLNSMKVTSTDREESGAVLRMLRAQRNIRNLKKGVRKHQHNQLKTGLGSSTLNSQNSDHLSVSNSKVFRYDQQSLTMMTVLQQTARKRQICDDDDCSRLTFFQFNMMKHLFAIVTKDHPNLLPSSIIRSVFGYIGFVIGQVYQLRDASPKFELLCRQVISELEYAQSFYSPSNHGTDEMYYAGQSWMIAIIHIYKCMADKYDTFRRKVLKILFQSFANASLCRPLECLRWLENHRLEILSLSTDYQAIITKAEKIIADMHSDRTQFLQQQNLKYTSETPKLKLVHLSDKNMRRRKTVNIWVSGFLSQDMEKKSQWSELVQYMPDSQVYAVQWQSNTIVSLMSFMGKSSWNLLTAQNAKQELEKKFKENPFTTAFEVAKYSGRYLAELVKDLFPDQFVNIAGYSLGTELIKQFMERMVESSSQSRISNFYMMGGVTDVNEFAGIMERSAYPMSVHNCYTDNDMVLKHVLSLCKPNGKAMGIHEIPPVSAHQVNNIDVSDIISGHLAYMNDFDVVGKIMVMERQ